MEPRDNLKAARDLASALRAAGWSEGAGSLPKSEALAAAARVELQPPNLLTLRSEGHCLIYGSGQTALDVGVALAEKLNLTVCLADIADALPAGSLPELIRGEITDATGHCGAFRVTVRNMARLSPMSRQQFEAQGPTGTTTIECDTILDVSGRPSLFRGCEERDGYIRANPFDPLSLGKAMLQATELVGEFEKPRYVEFTAELCAHSRNRRTGCSNCLDICPTGAISPDGDHVRIDPGVCEGCGLCSSVCPTGAITYANPAGRDLVRIARAAVDAFSAAGGGAPALLLYEKPHGEPIFDASARHGRGLQSNLIPLALPSVTQAGHDLLLSLLLCGLRQIAILVPRRHRASLGSLEAQVALAGCVLDSLGFGQRITVIPEDDPDLVEAALYDFDNRQPMPNQRFGLTGRKREIERLVLAALRDAAPLRPNVISLPHGAPYGRVLLHLERCSLCLACVSACPTGALRDDADRPALKFVETDCVQCGLCVATCPEQALALEPRLDFEAMPHDVRILKSEEPFHCRRCGKPFGTRSAIERVRARLSGNPHFPDATRLELVEMCADCRVVSVMEQRREPLEGAKRPRVVTSEDYMRGDSSVDET